MHSVLELFGILRNLKREFEKEATMPYVSVVHPKGIPVYGAERSLSLLGPIRNAPPWHERAIRIFQARMWGNYSLLIHCPKRAIHMEEDISDPLEIPIARVAPRQREWEWETQEHCVHSAGILFWLPRPGAIVHPEKVYGAMTQMELSAWLMKKSFIPKCRIAIGHDGIYNNELHTIMYDVKRLAPTTPIFSSLEDLCEQGIRWAHLPW